LRTERDREVMAPYIFALDSAEAVDPAVSGGKASTLARLARLGFTLPGGFVVSTSAYEEHLRYNELEKFVGETERACREAAAEQVDAVTTALRAAIRQAPIPPDVGDAIDAAYASMDGGGIVAVRSSGTAEDLAEASFAGQHDTVLNVRGIGQLHDAVRQCWASVWSARAVAYRLSRGFAGDRVLQALAVMEMVEADVAGVVFTANPLTGAVDEYLVNAAWGLGEGIASGVTVPDEFVLDRSTCLPKRRRLGSKELRIGRDPTTGSGTSPEPVPLEEQRRFSLTDRQLQELGRTAARIDEAFGDWPQDIEWAFRDDQLFVLQARDITGVEFDWDEDLENHGTLPRLRDDAVLSRARADTVWTGRITPLFYSLRAETRTLVTPRMYAVWAGSRRSQERWGGDGDAIGDLRWYKYLRGAVYYNSEVELRNHLQTIPRRVRDRALCEWTPSSWLADINDRPGKWWNMLWIAARIQFLEPRFNIRRVFASLNDEMRENARSGLGLDPEELRGLTDEALQTYVQLTILRQSDWVSHIAYVFYLYAPYMTAMLRCMLRAWNSEEGVDATFAELVTGLPRATYTVLQNEALERLATRITASPTLSELFKDHEGQAFFVTAQDTEEGRKFLEEYGRFLEEYGHRGHADRDIWYDRRSENPAIDYRALSLLVSAGEDRRTRPEATLQERRKKVTDDVLDRIGRGPLGPVKRRLFRRVHRFMLDFYVFRDDSRHHTDRNTFAKKRAVQEVARRLAERGVLDGGDDFYYLSKTELFALLDAGGRATRLVRAKIATRRRNCDRYRTEWHPPMYIRGDGTEWLDGAGSARPQEADGAALVGVAMSRGKARGRARIVPSLDRLGDVENGDILVARATDPGWTPCFALLAGLVLETGGALSHGALLSREYGLPAVQLPDAMRRLTDGATIEIDGELGTVTLVSSTAAAGVSP
jgi:phosphohistidine swiveling domain-containing protein